MAVAIRNNAISMREIQQVAQVDHALGDRFEMRRNDSDATASTSACGAQPLNTVQHQREAGEQEHEAHDHREDEGDDLVARQRRHARADREKAAGHQEAADVGGEDRAVVRLAEIVDGDPDREGEREREAGEQPGGEELAEHRLPQRDGQRHQQLDAAALALLGPQPHRDAPGSGTGTARGGR